MLTFTPQVHAEEVFPSRTRLEGAGVPGARSHRNHTPSAGVAVVVKAGLEDVTAAF